MAAVSDPHAKYQDMDQPQTRLAVDDYPAVDNTNVNNNVSKSRSVDNTNTRTPTKSKIRGSSGQSKSKSSEIVPLLDVSSSSDKVLLVDIKDWETIEEEIV